MLEYLIENPLEAHIGVIVIAAIIWLFRNVQYGKLSIVADVISAFSTIFAIEFYRSFMHVAQPAAAESPELPFATLGLLTFGLLPIITIILSWFFGRGIGRVIRAIYKKLS